MCIRDRGGRRRQRQPRRQRQDPHRGARRQRHPDPASLDGVRRGGGGGAGAAAAHRWPRVDLADPRRLRTPPEGARSTPVGRGRGREGRDPRPEAPQLARPPHPARSRRHGRQVGPPRHRPGAQRVRPGPARRHPQGAVGVHGRHADPPRRVGPVRWPRPRPAPLPRRPRPVLAGHRRRLPRAERHRRGRLARRGRDAPQAPHDREHRPSPQARPPQRHVRDHGEPPLPVAGVVAGAQHLRLAVPHAPAAAGQAAGQRPRRGGRARVRAGRSAPPHEGQKGAKTGQKTGLCPREAAAHALGHGLPAPRRHGPELPVRVGADRLRRAAPRGDLRALQGGRGRRAADRRRSHAARLRQPRRAALPRPHRRHAGRRAVAALRRAARRWRAGPGRGRRLRPVAVLHLGIPRDRARLRRLGAAVRRGPRGAVDDLPRQDLARGLGPAARMRAARGPVRLRRDPLDDLLSAGPGLAGRLVRAASRGDRSRRGRAARHGGGLRPAPRLRRAGRKGDHGGAPQRAPGGVGPRPAARGRHRVRAPGLRAGRGARRPRRRVVRRGAARGGPLARHRDGRADRAAVPVAGPDRGRPRAHPS